MTEAKQARSERSRRYYERRRSGLVVLHIELDEVAVIEELMYKGWLSPEDQGDRHKVQAAFASADMTVKVLARAADHGPGAVRRVQTTIDGEE